MSSSTAKEMDLRVSSDNTAAPQISLNQEKVFTTLKDHKVEVRNDKDTSLLHLLAGGIAGVLTRCVCQPFDVLKIRFQLQLDPITKKCDSAKYSGVLQAVKLIFRDEGINAFWKGHIPAQLLSGVYGAIQFYGFEYTKDTFYPNRNDLIPNIICGAVAGGMAMGVSHPLDVLRTRFVAQGEPKTYSGIWSAVITMHRREGPHAFYRGFFTNIVQVAPYNGLTFGFYHFCRPLLEEVPHVPANVVAGALAGASAKTAVYPFDLIKKRLQVQGFRDQSHIFGNYSGLISCSRSVWKTEGLLGFFKGYVPSCLKAMAMSACQFTFYEAAIRMLLAARAEELEHSADGEAALHINNSSSNLTVTSATTDKIPSIHERLAENQK